MIGVFIVLGFEFFSILLESRIHALKILVFWGFW